MLEASSGETLACSEETATKSSADLPPASLEGAGLPLTFKDPVLRLAVVQDNFVQAGGGERVAEEIARALPEADLFTSVVVRERLSPYITSRSVRTTWMQRLPSLKKYYRHYFLLYPMAIRSIPLDPYDIIVSSCYGYAKMLVKPKKATHICYCHTPTRWIWRYNDYARRENFSQATRLLLDRLVRVLQGMDRRAADRTDIFIANSTAVAARIRESYERDAEIIFPPIDCERFHISSDVDDYYLMVSRLVPYKRIDLAIEACRLLGRKLMIAGEGPARKKLEAAAGKGITFLGRISDAEVEERLSRCKAFLFPGEEDFGMAPLEANASGRPCIAFGSGGALDTVIEGVSGVLFHEPTAQSLAEAIVRAESLEWNPLALRKHAEAFDRKQFARKVVQLVSHVAETKQGLNRHAPQA